MVFSWTLFLLFISIQSTFALLKCDNFMETNCNCFPSDLELQCPKNASEEEKKIVVHINTDVTIDCYNMDIFDLYLLPKFTPEAPHFELKLSSCPLPTEGFKSVINQLSGVPPASLFFEDSDGIILTRDSFAGLQLQRITLRKLDFERIDDDVFSGVSNLTALEISRNVNVTLSVKLFQKLTGLEKLYLDSNELEDLADGLFALLGQLHILHLWGNKLTVIRDNTFEGLGNLKSLDLNSNKIRNISRGAFQNLSNLSALNLSGNLLTTLSSDVFSKNVHLKTVLMSYNFELEIPDHLFADLRSLETVDLSRCFLTSIPDQIFENCTNLTRIRLDGNKLTAISPILFQGLGELKKLSLEGNQITHIDEDTFEHLTKLEELNLKKNKIEKMHDNVLHGMKQLKILNLAGNFLETVNFGENTHLIKVDLTNNHIKNVNKLWTDNPLYNLLELEEFGLDNNLISEVQLNDLAVFGENQKLYISLNHNNVTKITWKNNTIVASGKTTISFLNNPVQCNCYLYKFLRSLKNKDIIAKAFTFESLECGSPQNLNGMKIEDLALVDLTCDLPNGCPQKCSCQYRPHDITVLIDCTNQSLTEFPVIDHDFQTPIELNLEFNNLTTGPEKSEGYRNVTRLFLSHNKIKNVGWLPPKLEVLTLDNNELTSLDHKVVDFFANPNLMRLSLHDNKWMCDCSAVNLSNFLREEQAKKIIKRFRCHNRNDFLVNLTEDKLCPNIILIILLPTVVFIVLCLVVLVLFFRFQNEIKIWLFAHDLFPNWLTEEDLDKDKLYDAFISYSHKDEDFVIQNLVPVLEGGPNPYKLCLHFRNWIPGEFILTQVTRSVLDSRRTLVVLSPNFLESVWGKTEFRTAHTQAMTEGRARVIIVLYGDVDIDKLDDELKAYMKTNTYVKWEDPYFWKKLKYALPHSKSRTSKTNQKIANAMTCIDDKFNLVVPVTNPGTTPPVLSLDSQALKKDPLNFVPSTEAVIV